MRSLTVGSNEAGQRLDKLLGKYLNLAGKGFIYKMLRKKNITLNGKKCDGSERLTEGDEIRLFLSDETIAQFSGARFQKGTAGKLDILYEDRHLLLVNKPAGMLSQKARNTDESLVEYVIGYLLDSGQITDRELKSFRPSVCNRLDRNTSGIVIAGKSLAGLQIVSQALKERSLHKYYQCIVAGRLEPGKRIRIEGYLTKDRVENRVTVTREPLGEDSQPIVTEYESLAAGRNYTRLSVALITGRSHQIRAHLASIGHPIAGDPKYGDREGNRVIKKRYGANSQLLHSWRIVMPEELPEPLSYLSGQEFTASLPRAMEDMIEGEKLWVPGTREG